MNHTLRKQSLTLLASLAILSSPLALSSCGDKGGSSLSYSEGWDDPWPDWPSESGTGSSTSSGVQCQGKCAVCGKCLDDDCEDTSCGAKCSDLNGRTLTSFKATDDKVKLSAGSMGPLTVNKTDDYIGNFNLNVGCSIDFAIASSAAEERVCLQAEVSQTINKIYFTSNCAVKVNDEQLLSFGSVLAAPNSEAWVHFAVVTLGCITLKEGRNDITLGVADSNGNQFNVRSIKLIANSSLSLIDANSSGTAHVCTTKDSNGKCTDYTCNEYECLDKEEAGWLAFSISGKADEVIKKSDGKANLWNDDPGEQCIGNIANEATHQTIVWSFAASEESYVSLSLLHSTCGSISYFTDAWDLTFNGVSFLTRGRTKNTAQSWTTYEDDKIGYVKAIQGTNTFKMVHKSTFGYNIRALDLTNQKGTLTLQQASLN